MFFQKETLTTVSAKSGEPRSHCTPGVGKPARHIAQASGAHLLAALLSLCYIRLDRTGSIVNTVILLCVDDGNVNIPRRQEQHGISPVAMAATA
jgi:hypothetical protein